MNPTITHTTVTKSFADRGVTCWITTHVEAAERDHPAKDSPAALQNIVFNVHGRDIYIESIAGAEALVEALESVLVLLEKSGVR